MEEEEEEEEEEEKEEEEEEKAKEEEDEDGGGGHKVDVVLVTVRVGFGQEVDTHVVGVIERERLQAGKERRQHGPEPNRMLVLHVFDQAASTHVSQQDRSTQPKNNRQISQQDRSTQS